MKKFLMIAFVSILSGCFFSTPNSTFYLLESNSDMEAVSQKRLNIAVQDVLLPDYLQKPQIVLQKENSPELKVSEFNRWGSDLEGMIQNTLIEDLQRAFPQAAVKPLLFGTKANYVIKLNIEKMTGFLREDAILSGTWQILNSYGKILKQSDFKLKTPAGKTYGSYVSAQSKLISELAKTLSENLILF